MNFDKYTIKSQEAIQKAAEIAAGNQQQAIEPGHLLKAILLTDENVISFLVRVPVLSEQITVTLPRVSTAGSIRTMALSLAILETA